MTKPYQLAVKAIIIDDQHRCLLIRRSAACRNFVGKWEWPGGKPETGEHFVAAVIRETREETSLDIDITGLGGATTFEMPAAHIILLCLEARARAGELHLSEEHDEFAWAPLSELSSWDLADQIKPFMLEYAQRKIAGMSW